MTCFTGWTWEYIDANMTIPRLKALTAYQKENPPIHIMIAAYLGAGKAKAAETNEDGQSLFDLFPQS